MILLKLKEGPWKLLKEMLGKALVEGSETILLNIFNGANESKKLTVYNARNALKEFGIIQLTIEQANFVLHLRIDYTESI